MLSGSLGGAMEDAVPVAVQSQGHPFLLYDLPEHQHIALSVLLLPEHRRQHLPRGVVHPSDQRQSRASSL